MSRTISNSDDVIDSRDVVARIEELEEERQALVDALQEAREAHETIREPLDPQAAENPDPEAPAVLTDEELADAVDDAAGELTAWDESEDGAELKALQALAEEAEGYTDDWKYGATLIRDSYFEEYARELADDIGAVDRRATWPNNFIDWPAAADALKQDYTAVDYDGVTYWVR